MAHKNSRRALHVSRTFVRPAIDKAPSELTFGTAPSIPYVKLAALGTEPDPKFSHAKSHPLVARTVPNDSIFHWNHRKCTGSDLHMAVMRGDVEEVRELLAVNPELLRSRFSYSVEFKGIQSKGSGEAIHIAASKGMLQMVKLLLEFFCDVNAVVDLRGEYHYSVIHAAAYAEGVGGNVDMISYLLEAKAEPKANRNGQTPLHIAYQTGCIELIKHLQDVLDESAENELEDPNPPLKTGIDRKTMKKIELADVAPLTSQSLRLFIHHEPGCVHHFLDRVYSAGVPIEDIGDLVDTSEILRVMLDSKQSADKLLELLCIPAKAEDPGHHSLPSRMSFKETSWFRSIRFLNPPRTLSSAYKPERIWAFDSESFKAPDWHNELVSLKEPPVPDVDISVSLTPNLICPEFFGTLLAKSSVSIKGSNDLKIFNNVTVKSAINEVWWGAAYRVELAQFLLTVTGLIALVHEAHFLEESSQDGGQFQGNSVAVAFVGSRAWLELFHKLAQLIGTRQRKTLLEYLEFRDVSEFFCCLIQMFFSYQPNNRWLHVLVILIYWVRMLEVNFAARLMRELLPIIRLGRDLVPSIAISVIFFSAFTHILYVLDTDDVSNTIYRSFSLLIEGSVSDKPSSDLLHLLFTYASQLLFTIFLLNVFIGVIGENYSMKKENAYLMSQEQRAVKCMEFLFVARSIPCGLLSRRHALFLQAVALSVNVAMQICGIGSGEIFFLCQVFQILGAYMDPECAWARNLRLELLHECDFYLWSFVPLTSENE